MKKKIYFSHIPKTAGRTITDIFEEVSKTNLNYIIGEKFFWTTIKKEHPHYYEYFLKRKYYKQLIKFNNNYHWNISFWHIPLSLWKDNLLLDYKKKYMIFCVVRNPYDRIVSDFKFWIKFYYLHKKSKHEKYYYSLLKQIETIYEKNFSLNKKNMNKVIQKLLSNNIYEYELDGHLIPQYKYVYTLINKKLIKIPDLIIYFEDLKKELKKYKQKYFPLIPNQLIENTHKNPTLNKNLNKSQLTKETKDLIFNYYEGDFISFHYKKE